MCPSDENEAPETQTGVRGLSTDEGVDTSDGTSQKIVQSALEKTLELSCADPHDIKEAREELRKIKNYVKMSTSYVLGECGCEEEAQTLEIRELLGLGGA